MPPDGSGKYVRTNTRTVGGTVVHEHYQIAVDVDTGNAYTPSNPFPNDIRELAGNTINVGAGTVGTGTARVAIASNANTVDTELGAPVTLADGTANTSMTRAAAYNMAFNGTSWDRAKAGTVFDGDTGAGTENIVGVVLRTPGSGGSTLSDSATATLQAAGNADLSDMAGWIDSIDGNLSWCDTDEVTIVSMPDITIGAGEYLSPYTAGADAFGAITVSTTAILLVAFSASSFGWLEITNNGSGELYIGIDNTVTTSGATMGLKVLPGGSFSVNFGATLGSIMSYYGIYSEAAATQNVAVMARGTFPD